MREYDAYRVSMSPFPTSSHVSVRLSAALSWQILWPAPCRPYLSGNATQHCSSPPTLSGLSPSCSSYRPWPILSYVPCPLVLLKPRSVRASSLLWTPYRIALFLTTLLLYSFSTVAYFCKRYIWLAGRQGMTLTLDSYILLLSVWGVPQACFGSS